MLNAENFHVFQTSSNRWGQVGQIMVHVNHWKVKATGLPFILGVFYTMLQLYLVDLQKPDTNIRHEVRLVSQL